MFKTLVDIFNTNATNNTVVQNKNVQSAETLLLLSTKELFDGQSSDTFCTTIMKLSDDKKMTIDGYFVNDKDLLHYVVRDEYELFCGLVVP